MKLTLSLSLLALFLGAVSAQEFPECTQDLLRTDDCAVVVNPTACYNQFRWSTRTLACIDGTDDADRKRKVKPHARTDLGEASMLQGMHSAKMNKGKERIC
jgi:hypothetical protein